eukprot:gene13130-13260_t
MCRAGTGPACGYGYLNYTLNQTTTLYSLVAAHTAAQTAALLNLTAHGALASGGNSSHPKFKAILVKADKHVGLGNRIPSIITGYLIALLSRRIFLLDAALTQYLDIPLAGAWESFGSHYNVTDSRQTCVIRQGGGALANLNLSVLCGQQLKDPPLITLISYDYDIPWLQINDDYAATIKHLFPKGEVFHELSKLLLRAPKPLLAAALAPYAKLRAACSVGMHLRTVRLQVQNVSVSEEAFVAQVAGIAEGLSQQTPGSLFLASDSKNVLPLMLKAMPGRLLWWNNMSMEVLAAKKHTAAGNPGTELTAVMDMLLLSSCKRLVLTPASSFGYAAAGLAGTPGVVATLGTHEQPFFNTWCVPL